MPIEERIVAIMEEYQRDIGGDHWSGGSPGVPEYYYNRVAEAVVEIIAEEVEKYCNVTYESS